MPDQLINNRYLLGAPLGSGGMGDVWSARDTQLKREVAVKLLNPGLTSDPVHRERFRREAEAAAGLSHPNIVTVFDNGEYVSEANEDGGSQATPYIVMELVVGKTLRELLQTQGQFRPEKALEITVAVLAALSHSHHKGIVHRDIKPVNVMVSDAGEVKVMDFGIARVEDAASGLTMPASVIGTPHYLSPEQARGETADHRSDLYSVGCLLYELLTGRPPFLGESAIALAVQHLQAPVVAPSTLDGRITPTIDAICAKALAKNREDRYQTALEMSADLSRVRAQAEASTLVQPIFDQTKVLPNALVSVPLAPVSLKTKPKRRTGLIVGLIMGLILVGGGTTGVLLALNGKESGGLETPPQSATTPPTSPTADSTGTVPEVTEVVIGGRTYSTDLTSLSLFLGSLTDADIEPLRYMTSLTSLRMDFNSVSDLSPLSELVNLRELSISYNNISDITSLSKLVNLQTLDLTRNQVQDVRTLGKLTSLTTLILDDNRITDLTALSSLTELTKLSLNKNTISSVSALHSLGKLTKLELSGNLIVDVGAIGELSVLQDLTMDDNLIANIQPLAGLVYLKTLSLNTNQISDLQPLETLVGLESLHLNSNQISDVQPLFKLGKLTSLWLSRNLLTAEQLAELRQQLPRCLISG
ncbi:MAG: leucine-rich repeat domain-containing protein [Propionibacteriaceae bacterium]|jgi:serine/threonine protein kinase|nr:leucine-rich repeat domain-containing protein [Propionibacteriaceae bacterium]